MSTALMSPRRVSITAKLDVPITCRSTLPDLPSIGSPLHPGAYRLYTRGHETNCVWRVFEILYPGHDEYAAPKGHADELPCNCAVQQPYFVVAR